MAGPDGSLFREGGHLVSVLQLVALVKKIKNLTLRNSREGYRSCCSAVGEFRKVKIVQTARLCCQPHWDTYSSSWAQYFLSTPPRSLFLGCSLKNIFPGPHNRPLACPATAIPKDSVVQPPPSIVRRRTYPSGPWPNPESKVYHLPC